MNGEVRYILGRFSLFAIQGDCTYAVRVGCRQNPRAGRGRRGGCGGKHGLTEGLAQAMQYRDFVVLRPNSNIRTGHADELTLWSGKDDVTISRYLLRTPPPLSPPSPPPPIQYGDETPLLSLSGGRELTVKSDT